MCCFAGFFYLALIRLLMSLSLHPFPRFFTPPPGQVNELPATRNGVHNVPAEKLNASRLPAFAELTIRHHTTGRRSRGICGLLPAAYFLDGSVRPHEKTLLSRLKRQEELVVADAGALGKPVLLTVPSLRAWWATQDARHEYVGMPTSFRGTNSTYEVRHYVAADDDLSGDRFLTHPIPLPETGPLSIADGHHRAETHARLAARGLAACAFIPVCIIGADELNIESFTRVISATTPLQALLPELKEFFDVHLLSGPYAPTARGEWLLARNGLFYRLIRKEKGHPESLDVAWMESLVLPAVFGITDTREDERITFIPTPPAREGLLDLPGQPDTTYLSGFPLPVNAFFAEIKAGRCLPPKSTRFEPRVPSGLVVWVPET